MMRRETQDSEGGLVGEAEREERESTASKFFLQVSLDAAGYQDKVPPMEGVPRQHLPASKVSATGSPWALSLDPSQLPQLAGSSGNLTRGFRQGVSKPVCGKLPACRFLLLP